MAIPTRYAPKRAHVPYWWFLATAVAAVIAIGPIAAALFATLGGGNVARTAFASAPAGNYAVVVRPETDADVVLVVPADGAGESEIARVPRLPGYTSYGAVSPDGRRLALVVADGGTQARPIASLVLVELESGETTKLTDGVDYLQTPVWTRDGGTIVVSRSTSSGPASDVDLVHVKVDGSGESIGARARAVLGAYPVGFDADGLLIHVVIDARGSVAYRAGTEVASLAAGVTRDWKLSPDGSSLAFIETSTTAGVQYFARTAELSGGPGRASALTAADVVSLGVAWKPGANEPTFGREPGAVATDNSRAQSAPGFDVPLAYSADGSSLAVQHWSGESFSQPGEGALQLLVPGGDRLAMEDVARFFGWATR